MAKATRKGRRQTELAGMERPRDEEIEAAADDLVEANQKLSKAHDLREERSKRLLELMKKKGLSTYKSEDDSFRIDVVHTESEKVKVTKLERSDAETNAEAAQ